jgi:serine/threonine protein kinase
VAGRYELGPVIGVGSSAVVRRARDLRDDAPVAVKQFHPGASALDLRQQRQEIATLEQLHHPGLVALHDGGTEDGRPFVVTDLVEGPTLAERIRTGPLRPDEVLRLGALLAGALAHVHSCGIVHRDVKPANVLLGDGARPRLADFGIARALDGTVATEAGCVVGTAAYLAPEQVRGERVGPPADVYALGLVLLEALTARREYPGLAVESATARLHRVPAVPAGLPAGLGPLLEAMTYDDPERRPTAAAVAAALAGDRSAPASGPVATPRARRGRHRLRRPGRRATPRAAAALVLTALGGGLATLAGLTVTGAGSAGAPDPVPMVPSSAIVAPASGGPPG